MTHDVFISHASVDKPAADAVCHGLEARGVRCWMAPRDQIAGKAYGQQITEAIRGARVMVLVFSENVNQSQAVLNEIHLAAAAEVTIVPFRISGVEFNPELNYYLGRTHWLDAFPQPIDTYIDALAATVQRNLPDVAPDGAAPPPQRPPPQTPPSLAPPSLAPPPAAPPPPALAARPNHVPLMIFGGLFALVLLVAMAALLHKPSRAQEHASDVIAQAVANAITQGAKDDDSPTQAGGGANAASPEDRRLIDQGVDQAAKDAGGAPTLSPQERALIDRRLRRAGERPDR